MLTVKGTPPDRVVDYLSGGDTSQHRRLTLFAAVLAPSAVCSLLHAKKFHGILLSTTAGISGYRYSRRRAVRHGSKKGTPKNAEGSPVRWMTTPYRSAFSCQPGERNRTVLRYCLCPAVLPGAPVVPRRTPFSNDCKLYYNGCQV